MADNPGRTTIAWSTVLFAALAQALVLTLGSLGYGYHRDELYFRMLPPAWGYVDQPPLTPLLVRLTLHLSDTVWALRIPATVASAVAVVLVGLVARELGGGRLAQGLASWGYAFAVFPLILGHVLLTSTVDLPLLLLVVLAVLRAVGGSPRAWLLAGVVVGVDLSNRVLVVVVLGGLVVGLVLLGPRETLRTSWPWLGAVAGLVLGAPQVAYQATHGWPQLAMGKALAANNASDVRSQLPFLLVVMLGPPFVVVWGLGFGWLLRRSQRRGWGFLAVGFLVLLAFTVASAAQPHYPVHLMAVMYAAGCVPLGRWLAGRRGWRTVVVAAVTVNAAVAVVLALPVVPLARLGSTPVPGTNLIARDQVGWPAYVREVATAYDGVRSAVPAPALITSNYGEAGAVARYGPALGLPRPLSGQNGLWDLGGPGAGVRVVVMVGGQLDEIRRYFAQCHVVARLDDGLGVDNEEQGQPVAVCSDPTLPWWRLWPHLRHLD